MRVYVKRDILVKNNEAYKHKTIPEKRHEQIEMSFLNLTWLLQRLSSFSSR